MMPNSKFKDFSVAKKEVETEMIKNILEYLKNGVFPNHRPNSYMNAYTAVLVCIDSGNDETSQKLLDYHNNTIETYIKECYDEVNKETNINLIDAFIYQTDHITILIYWMNRIFCYLDRFYTKAKVKSTLAKCALNLYKNKFFENLKEKIFTEVNKLIKEDRRGNRDYRPKIKNVMKILRYLDFQNPKIVKENNRIFWTDDLTNNEKPETEIQNIWYDNYFEGDTAKFASDKGKNDIQTMSAPEYVLSQLKYLDEEYEREREFIHEKYYERINKINYEHLIGTHMKEIASMDTGIKNMLETKNDIQLTNLYKLFKLYPASLNEITEEFQPYIKNRGNVIYENKELSKDPKKFIPELISLKKEMDKLVYECFENNNDFQDVKNKAFSLFMKRDVYAKQLSNYADYCMRLGFKGKSQEEIENTLNDIIDLFKCLNSKLVFQNEANKKMSERLIKKQNLSTLAERMFITKLKQEAGVTYVSKMQEMMNDLEKNKNETDNYKLLPHKGAPNGIKLDITVISQSAWEISKKSMEKLEMPKYLSSCLDDFEQFYLKKHQGQKLIWCLGLSKIDIEYLYLKHKNISVSTLPQLLSLLLLEKHEKLTLGKIAEYCGCQSATIITDIPGLVYNTSFNPKGSATQGIIIGNFDAQTKEFKETDEISLNKNFVCSRIKISTIPLPPKKSASEIKAAELEEAQIIKRYQDNILQASLTRIMKSRIGQETTHVWLVSEAAKQIDLFKAQPQQIKENIEKLIEKNVIKRNAKNRTCYDYIA